jgi:uncharacterized protein (TIGR03435 family)
MPLARSFASNLLLALLALTLAAPLTLAQPPAAPEPSGPPAYVPTLTFDVASVRETQQPDDNPSWQMGLISQPHSSQFQANGINVGVLIKSAYGFGAYEISGAPAWIDDSFWVVQAKSDHSVDDQLAKLTDDQAKLEKQHMMQALLADRFKLKVHWETRQASTYSLVIANPKSGSKLTTTKIEIADPSIPNAPQPETKGADIQNIMDAHGHVMTVSHISATGIAALLGALLRANVQDKTGLTDRYDFTLHYTYQSTDPDSYATLPTAIQEQLGLKLESSKGPVPVLVIDHIERPTPN